MAETTVRLTAVPALLLVYSVVVSAETTKVRIDFVEALALRDTTSSERFQRDYEGAIQISKTMLAERLNKCGFTLDTKTAFFDATDALKAKELSAKSESEGAWIIIGPRRSNHYLLLVQGVQNTPTVSLMASADKLAVLGKSHVSISPTNSEMARAAAQEALARKGAKATYVSVVSDDCSNCVDFSKAFDTAADALGLKKLDELKVIGESFDIEAIRTVISKKHPKFVLLPNYSNVSSKIMSAFNYSKYSPLFIGGDGWGDSRYGFVQSGQQVENVNGLTVRGFPPVQNELNQFSLGREVLKQKKEIPFSAANIAIMKVMDSISSTLCSNRPSTKAEFLKSFEGRPSSSLRAPWGVSIYDLKNGQIVFNRTRKIKQ